MSYFTCHKNHGFFFSILIVTLINIKRGINRNGGRKKNVEICKLSVNWALLPQLTHSKHWNTFIELHPAHEF